VIDRQGEAVVTDENVKLSAFPLVHHSDRGVQYTATEYRALLESHEIQLSMGWEGNCYDKVPMESANATVKTERVSPYWYASRTQAKANLIA